MADTPAATAKPPVAEPQDPLPESNWVWRRGFVFALCATVLFGMGWYTDTISRRALTGDGPAIQGLIDLLFRAYYLLGVLILFYLIAPSAEQVIKMLATLSAWKSGVSTTSTSKAMSADGSTAQATTSAGPAVGSAKVTPPVAPAAPAATIIPGDAPLPWRSA